MKLTCSYIHQLVIFWHQMYECHYICDINVLLNYMLLPYIAWKWK